MEEVSKCTEENCAFIHSFNFHIIFQFLIYLTWQYVSAQIIFVGSLVCRTLNSKMLQHGQPHFDWGYSEKIASIVWVIKTCDLKWYCKDQRRYLLWKDVQEANTSSIVTSYLFIYLIFHYHWIYLQTLTNSSVNQLCTFKSLWLIS